MQDLESAAPLVRSNVKATSQKKKKGGSMSPKKDKKVTNLYTYRRVDVMCVSSAECSI